VIHWPARVTRAGQKFDTADLKEEKALLDR
jgi:hypothetical protein